MAAVREVREETGVTGQLIEHIGEVEYSYRFRGRTIHKRVSFFLLRYLEGVIDALEPSMRREVDRAFWIPLDEAESRLAYPGEKEVVAKAMQWLESKNFVLKAPHP